MADRKLTTQINNIHDIGDVLLILKESIFSELKVASLARFNYIVKSFDSEKGYGIAAVKPFPTNEDQEEHIDYVYFFANIVLNKNDFVLVIYTDLDFRDNLKVTNKQITESNGAYHNACQGVLLPLKSFYA